MLDTQLFNTGGNLYDSYTLYQGCQKTSGIDHFRGNGLIYHWPAPIPIIIYHVPIPIIIYHWPVPIPIITVNNNTLPLKFLVKIHYKTSTTEKTHNNNYELSRDIQSNKIK